MRKKGILTDKNVIVTGASSGIGRELTRILIRENGCTVIGIARNEERLEALVEELGNRFTYRLFDVSVEKNWNDFAAFLKYEAFNPDILINCAGVLPEFGLFENMTAENAESVMRINFFSSVYSVRNLLPLLKRSENALIVNVSSSAALAPVVGTAMYSASKCALKGFSEALREELSGEIRVSVVCPGFTKTDIFRNQKNAALDRLVGFAATPCVSASKRIIRRLKKDRKLIVTGSDAHLMRLCTAVLGQNSFPLYRKVLSSAHLKMFDGVFKH